MLSCNARTSASSAERVSLLFHVCFKFFVLVLRRSVSPDGAIAFFYFRIQPTAQCEFLFYFMFVSNFSCSYYAGVYRQTELSLSIIFVYNLQRSASFSSNSCLFRIFRARTTQESHRRRRRSLKSIINATSIQI